MAAETRPCFSTACPRCGAVRVHPTVQRNDFAAVDRRPGGRAAAERVSTTREYHCRACDHAWAETVGIADWPPAGP